MSKMRDREMVEGRPSRFVGLDEHGVEHPDPTPVEVPTRLRMPGNQVERMRTMIRRELSQSAERNSFESFDEADDFEMAEVEWSSPYENEFEPSVAELRRREKDDTVEARRNGAAKESGDGRRVEVERAGKEDGSVGVGPGGKGARAAGGSSGGVAGSSGGAGSASERGEGGKNES